MQTKRENHWIVFLLEQPRKNQDGTNHAQKNQRGPTTWKDMLENAWNGIANRQTRRQSNYTRFPVLVWTTTKLKKEVRSLLQYCIQNSCTWHELVDLTHLWSVNKLARSVTKWTQACDRRLARLISYIHYTSDYRQYCHVANAV